ncbi:hypothetical protein PM082_014018 [Marasmius tenuissimus]|nr:hypothetical protein PM082_014018 [Marasmius tenuissimus]
MVGLETRKSAHGLVMNHDNVQCQHFYFERLTSFHQWLRTLVLRWSKRSGLPPIFRSVASTNVEDRGFRHPARSAAYIKGSCNYPATVLEEYPDSSNLETGKVEGER